ncbi:glycosyltransferase family 4 protein [Parabacteroides distasonis]|nr:glycosyltransferase family 4 protein [Parabacteroides distasonis]
MRPDSRTVFLEMAFKKDVPTCSCYVLKQLLFVGTVYQRKGLLYLLEAIGQMSEKERSGIHLDIVGDLSQKKYYKCLLSLVHLYGLEDIVTFVGRISDEELRSYYSRAYCFVFPSLLEGYGMVLIEAMSYGLPVIAFDNSAIPFTVKNDRNGILVRNKSILDLKKAILKLCVDTDYHRKLCDGALDTYRNARSLSDLDIDIENFVIKELIN